jgi:hypothetical protein
MIYLLLALTTSFAPALVFADTTSAVSANPANQDTTAHSEIEAEELDVPRYQLTRPNWGLELSSSLNALGGQALTAEQGTQPFAAFSITGEYQPPWTQSFGIFSLGPSLTLYPLFGGKATTGPFSVFSVGGQIRYQARYFREQILVPVVGYELECLKYNFTNGKAGAFLSQGPFVGLWFLLNVIDATSAGQFYLDSKVSRTYLVAELRSLKGGDDKISVAGESFYFGLRFEF